jgi:hypothetical protein
MSNNTRASARNQVKHFLLSDQSLDYKLDSYDVAILYVIASYLDMPKGQCFADKLTLVQEIKCTERHFRNRVNKLINHEILFRYNPADDKRDHYLLGPVITGLYL